MGLLGAIGDGFGAGLETGGKLLQNQIKEESAFQRNMKLLRERMTMESTQKRADKTWELDETERRQQAQTGKVNTLVVHAVGEKLTYQPSGELGQAATDLATKPFQWLAEKGQEAGTATLEVTGSPLAATVVDTTIQGVLSSIFLDEHHLRTKLEKYYRDQGIDYKTVLDTPDKILTFMETLGDAFEMSTRLGEYNRAITRGENPRHAAYQGREVSTDFAMMGDSKALQFMYNTVMFLRPAVVSMDRLYRGVAHDPNKGAIIAKTGSFVSCPP